MAKANTTLDEALYDGLQQARKKKARYYALIAKGADVVGLIVQKKKISDGQAQKAKAASQGNLVIQGVCQGEGVELTFEVLEAEPSIKPAKIKEFIDEQTELTLKPKWAVVPQLTVVIDDDASSPATAAPAPTAQTPPMAQAPPGVVMYQTQAPPSVQPQSTPQLPPGVVTYQNQAPTAVVDAQALQARLKQLLETHKQLVEQDPTCREALLAPAQAAATLVMRGSPDAANALNALNAALGQAAAKTATNRVQPAAAPSAGKDWAAELAQRHLPVQQHYAKVDALLDPHITTITNLTTVLTTAMQEAKAIGQRDFRNGFMTQNPDIQEAMLQFASKYFQSYQAAKEELSVVDLMYGKLTKAWDKLQMFAPTTYMMDLPPEVPPSLRAQYQKQDAVLLEKAKRKYEHLRKRERRLQRRTRGDLERLYSVADRLKNERDGRTSAVDELGRRNYTEH